MARGAAIRALGSVGPRHRYTNTRLREISIDGVPLSEREADVLVVGVAALDGRRQYQSFLEVIRGGRAPIFVFLCFLFFWHASTGAPHRCPAGRARAVQEFRQR